MKYCPYCGASVLDDTVSFCSECGKKLSIPAKQPEGREQPKPAMTTSFRQTQERHAKV